MRCYHKIFTYAGYTTSISDDNQFVKCQMGDNQYVVVTKDILLSLTIAFLSGMPVPETFEREFVNGSLTCSEKSHVTLVDEGGISFIADDSNDSTSAGFYSKVELQKFMEWYKSCG